MQYIEIVDPKNRCNPFMGILEELDRLTAYVILLQERIIELSVHDTPCTYNTDCSTCNCSVAETINRQF